MSSIVCRDFFRWHHLNADDDLPACDKLKHPVFSHSLFRSIMFRKFRDRPNDWEIKHNNLHAEDSEGATCNAALPPAFGRLKPIQSGNKKQQTRMQS